MWHCVSGVDQGAGTLKTPVGARVHRRDHDSLLPRPAFGQHDGAPASTDRGGCRFCIRYSVRSVTAKDHRQDDGDNQQGR